MHIFINTYGTSLRIRDGLLSIKKDEKIERVPIGKVEKLFLTKSIHLSTDVLFSCLEHAVDVVITERNGKPIGRLWNNRFGSISTLRKQQLTYSQSSHVTVWVVDQLRKKGGHQIEMLSCLYSLHDHDKVQIKTAQDKMSTCIERLHDYSVDILADVGPQIRAIEGQMARYYFACMSRHLPTRYQFAKRSKRPARDMFNAMLNYSYGILYSHVESSLIKAGLDPYIGFFHRDEYNRPALTYDTIEPLRPWADWVVFHLCTSEVLEVDHFKISGDSYWLHGDSKRILIQHFTDFFDEVVDLDGQRLSRFSHIDHMAASLASLIRSRIQGDEQ